MQAKNEIAVFGGGCFWCTEAIFKRLKGVISVVSGFAGGKTDNPSYHQVTTGQTGHAESVQVTFDPMIISYTRLLDVFWATHNPTTVNQQAFDRGTEYRSIILYTNEQQKKQAYESKEKIEKEHVYPDSIVTKIAPLNIFYTAQEYHQNFYDKYESEPYCTIIINPKIKKLLERFGKDIKEEYRKEVD